MTKDNGDLFNQFLLFEALKNKLILEFYTCIWYVAHVHQRVCWWYCNPGRHCFKQQSAMAAMYDFWVGNKKSCHPLSSVCCSFVDEYFSCFKLEKNLLGRQKKQNPQHSVSEYQTPDSVTSYKCFTVK